MKTLSVTLALVLLTSLATGATQKYPRLEEVQGKVRWMNKDDQEATPKNKQLLVEKAVLETPAGARVVIQIDALRRVQVLPNSRVELPSISWEQGQSPVVVLKYGEMRWQEQPGKDYNIALRSDLFQFISPVGDFVFSFDPKTAVAEVKVIKGSMEFSAMGAEDVALVTAGQKCKFQGVREGDEIVYDVLLKGKKIPRGKLGLVENFSVEDKRLYSAAQAKKEESQRRAREEAAKKAAIPQRQASEICEQPFGKLNQCAWICENNPKNEKKLCRVEDPQVRCVRKRCNANGEWAEETLVSKEKAASLCGLKPQVRECDY